MVDLTARLEAAALSLAGPGNIKDRLLQAYHRHLQDIQGSDLPGELGTEFAHMISALHRSPALKGDDVVRASVRKMSSDEAGRYAGLVVRLYGLLAGLQYRAPTRALRPVPPLTPLTPYLAAEAGGS